MIQGQAVSGKGSSSSRKKDDRFSYVDMLDDNKDDILRKLRGREERRDVETVNWDDREKERKGSV